MSSACTSRVIPLAPISGLYMAAYIASDGRDNDLPAFLGKLKAR